MIYQPPFMSRLLQQTALALVLVAALGVGCHARPPVATREITAIYMTGVYATAARSLAPEFERETGIRVNIISAPYLTLHEKELTELINGSCHYDVMQVAQQWDGEFSTHLLPLDNLIAAHGPDLHDFISTVRQNCGEWHGTTYGLPMASDAITLLYRTDIFAARAAEFKRLTGHKLEPPGTWADYIRLARFFNTESLYGNIVMGLKEQNFTVWSGIFFGMGGQLVDDDWQPTLNSAVGVRSLSLFVDMFRYAPPNSQMLGTEEANALFLRGQGAMYLTWPSLIWKQMQDTNLCKVYGKIAAAVIPGKRPQISAWSLGINRTSTNRDAAFQWVRFFVNKTNTKRLLLEYGKGSPRISTYRDVECRQKVPYLPQVREGLESGETRFRIPPSQTLCDYLDNQISEAVAGHVTPKVALDRTAEYWRTILKRTGYLKDDMVRRQK
ncbi:MAG: ABC transporter substrate-binding protein [Limisphaerales bacterium]